MSQKLAKLHSSVPPLSAHLHCTNFLCVRRKTRDKPGKFDEHGGSTFHARTIMIRLGSQIRLTHRQVEHFRKITDIDPVGIRTLDDLETYIARCKAYYWGVSKETQFLHWLIDREYVLCRRAA